MDVFLKKELDDAKFSNKIIQDEILMVENFLSKEELEEVFSIINNLEEDDWSFAYREGLKSFCLEKFGRDDVDNLVKEGKFEVTVNWFDKNYDITKTKISRIILDRLQSLITKANPNLELAGMATLQRMQPKVELKSHTDQHTDPSIRYATILYLNNNYKDGQLFFKNKPGLELVPDPGTLLVFPGNEEYEHGVRHVGEGPIRHVLVGFVKEKNFYEKNKY
jgi:hypothetical protein